MIYNPPKDVHYHKIAYKSESLNENESQLHHHHDGPQPRKSTAKKVVKPRDYRILPSYFFDVYNIFNDDDEVSTITSFAQIGMLDPFPNEVDITGLYQY